MRFAWDPAECIGRSGALQELGYLPLRAPFRASEGRKRPLSHHPPTALGIVPSWLNGSAVAAEHVIAAALTHDGALDLRAREPDVFELAVGHRSQTDDGRLLHAQRDDSGPEALGCRRQHAKYVAAGAIPACGRAGIRAHD